MDEKSKTLRILFHYARIPVLLVAILTYVLGAGLARFLGITVNPSVFFLGLAYGLLVLLSSGWVQGFYDGPEELQSSMGEAHSEILIRRTLLESGLVSMGVAALLVALMLINGQIQLLSATLMLLLFVFGYFYSVPPVRLVQRGYGELVNAFLLGNLMPAFAYSAQSGDLHRLLGMITFPLATIILAYQLANSLEPYASDLKLKRRTMMVALGWQRGMNLHNLLVLGAYFILGLAALFGLPWSLTWPVLLTLPVGLFEIWLMIRISNGGKPAWKLLSFTSSVLVILTAYLITFALWIG